MNNSKYLPVVFFAFLSSATITVVAETEVQPIEKLVSELAEKPEQHAAVAKYYQEKAEEAKKEAAHHREMKKGYYTFNPKSPGAASSMQAHCDKLISAYETQVKEYEQLAAEHEKLAH